MRKTLTEWANKFKAASSDMTAIQTLKDGIHVITDRIGTLPIFVSLEQSDQFDSQALFDEKHYFVVPFVQSETGFVLHTTRCLPEGVPELNDLPKRRIFHLPNEHYEASLREHMLRVLRENSTNNHEVSSIEKLADAIDEFDKKLTYGMLIIGGIAVMFNPLIGAGIAAKAVLPSVGGLLNKFTLRPIGEKLSQRQLKKQIENTQNQVLSQFSHADTLKVTNPILRELELALRTTETQHDPLTDPNFANADIPQLNSTRWRQLTELAILHIYDDIYQNEALHQAAQLGPEDIRWLTVLFAGHRKDTPK